MKRVFSLFFLIIGTISLVANAQQPTAQSSAINKKTASIVASAYQLDSKLMNRKMPYNVLLPENYEKDKSARFPVVYLLHGFGGSYTDWVEKTKLLEFAAQHKFIIVTVEGGNGWYTDSASKPNDKYESYIIQELIPAVDQNFRTIAARRARAVAGLSMGGYGALKFGLKYPDKFVFAASMSGAVSVASWKTSEQIPAMLRPTIVETFGDENNSVKKANDLFVIFAGLAPDKIVQLPFFYFDCGTEDQLGLLEFNRQLAAIMSQKNIPHEFRELPGKHSWDLWGQQIEDVLRISERAFNAQTTVNVASAR